MSSRRRKAIEDSAWHEAGHAVACLVLRRRLSFASIDGRGGGLVRCSQHPNLDPRHRSSRSRIRRNIRREIVITWAGIMAAARASGRRTAAGDLRDAEGIVTLLNRLSGSPEEQIAIGRWLREAAEELLHQHWSAVKSITKALVEQHRLSGIHCRRLAGKAIAVDRSQCGNASK